MKKKEQRQEDKSEEFRRFPKYVLLSCGIIILSIGVYLIFSHRLAQGITLPGRTGQGGGQFVTLNGVSVAVIGLLLCIFPLYVLVRKAPLK
jgi:hypothetical protein